jgi:hypothetical protein
LAFFRCQEQYRYGLNQLYIKISIKKELYNKVSLVFLRCQACDLYQLYMKNKLANVSRTRKQSGQQSKKELYGVSMAFFRCQEQYDYTSST